MELFLEQHTVDAIRDGRFEFAYAMHPLLALGLVVLFGGLVWLLYRKTTRKLGPAWRRTFIGLRVVVLVLIFLMLLRPAVNTWQVNPQESYLAIVVDNSASMTVADSGGEARVNRVHETLYGNNGIVAPLGELFQVRVFAFDSDARRVNEPAALDATGTNSWLAQALEDVENQLGGLSLGAVVLISDGADNGAMDPVAAAQRFGNRQVPVFTMGVGEEQIPRDVDIVEVRADETLLDDTVFNVQVTLAQAGYADRDVELRIRDGEQVVSRKTVQLGPDGSQRRFEMELEPERREPIEYVMEVDELDDELITENNEYRFLVDNSERPPLNILYVEGHPRNEFKFIRRAAENDSNLRLASYLETGPGRSYRQGLRNALELSSGFPESREALYRYDAIILGDVGRDFFTDDQVELIQDFVAERGGGLLVSGMMEDAYVESRIADILPLTLVRGSQLPQFLQGGTRRGSHATGEAFTPQLTREGELSPILRLDGDSAMNRQQWNELPELQGVYVTGRPKPGATVLMEHPRLQYQGQAAPVIATQRYGSGRAMAVTTASTWRWQMLMHSSDDTHERLWRQKLRWLASSAPERISIEFDQPFYHAGDEVTVTATVHDERFEPDNNASLWLQLTDPEGQVSDRAMEWDISEDGVYRSRFTVEEEGVYRALLDVVSDAGSELDNDKHAAFAVTPSLREYSNAGRDTGMLTRIAQASGGRHYDIGEGNRMLNDVEYTPSAYSRETREDLWDHPLLLFLLIALLSTDWALRRQKGLS